MSNQYDENILLAKRNIEAMNEGMKHFERMRALDNEQVQQLQATVTQLAQQVQKLTIDVALLRAKTQGHGATT
jgi:hypothetical protein